MQSLPQTHPQPNPPTASATEQLPDTEVLPAPSEPAAPEKATKAAPSALSAGKREAETPSSMAVPPLEDGEPGTKSQAVVKAGNTGEVSAANLSGQTEPAPATETNAVGDRPKARKQDKLVIDRRKCVPSKKAMIDPLKMDMSKPLVMPLTSSELSLQCIECHIIFSDHKSKERHLKLSHPAEYEQCILRNSLFTCYVCDHHFTNSTDLMVHQKAHTEKKPFKCPICNQAFKKSSELTVHKKVHFGQDGYACTECGKTCKTLTLLKYHQRTHTGERPYGCTECGKKFSIPTALHKHMMAHLDGGEVNEVVTKVRKPRKKKDGAPETIFSCQICKATFKTSKARQHHMKTKHRAVPTGTALSSTQQATQLTPIITPISISQPTLLQVEPNGPLQKVDSDIDTENIRKLIETLGNVKKVNQVVILGQVPPNAPPLEVQQALGPTETLTMNLNSPQLDFLGLKRTSYTSDLDPSIDPMEQTIILEPITPDGQLINPPISNLDCSAAAGEHIELTFVNAEQTERHEGMPNQVPPQSEITSNNTNPLVFHNEENNLQQNLDQTVILELTPLTPTIEQPQTESQSQFTSSPLMENGDQATSDHAEVKETNISLPPLISTAELELTTPESSCTTVPPDAFTQAPTEAKLMSKKDDYSSEVKMNEINEETHNPAEVDLSEKPVTEEEKKLSNLTNSQTEDASKSQPNPPSQNELPMSVMSAQELVKVRKRKPARTFFFQGYMQDLVGSIYRDDFQINAKPAKRPRAKKSHLVKFVPQIKEKKNKKQKNLAEQQKPVQENMLKKQTAGKKLAEKKVQSPKKTGKGKKEKMGTTAVAQNSVKSAPNQPPHAQQVKSDPKKNKIRKQKEPKADVANVTEQNTDSAPTFKEKKQSKVLQKDKSKNVKEVKGKKPLSKKQSKKGKAPDSPVTPDSLLLLKGHKQPQLKVYKLDPSKASGQTPETSPQDSKKKSKKSTSKSTANSSAGGKKKLGVGVKKNQKALTLLAPLQVSHDPAEPVSTKVKTSRKRKAPLNVETEGVITSKRALQCKDCGEMFGDVSTLQKHKTTAHIIESPSLTFTNGNIFEGVSRLDLYQLPKGHDKVVRVLTAPTDWDTEPEVTFEDKERCVSFPALIPSPSLPGPPPDIGLNSGELQAADQSHTFLGVQASANEILGGKTETQFSLSDVTKGCGTSAPLVSAEDGQEEVTAKGLGSMRKAQGAPDEDMKEDLLLEVDLITVGEQSERENPITETPTPSQMESSKNSDGESTRKRSDQLSNERTEQDLFSQTVSCSTHQLEVKEEEVETLVQERTEVMKKVSASKGLSKATEHLHMDLISDTSSVGDEHRRMDTDNEQDECQMVYEKQAVSSDFGVAARESSAMTQTSPQAVKAAPPAPSIPSSPAAIGRSRDQPVVFELASLTTSVEEGINERPLQGGRDGDQESDRSPGNILERFLTSRPRETSNKEAWFMAGKSNERHAHGAIVETVDVPEGQHIKVEENTPDSMLVGETFRSEEIACPQSRDRQSIRSVLVKEESTASNEASGTRRSKQKRWNVEAGNDKNINVPTMEVGEVAQNCPVTPEVSSNQCIFYPVKEEEREVLLGAAQSLSERLPSERSNTSSPEVRQTVEDEGSSPAVSGLLAETADGILSDGQAGSDSEWQHPSDLRDFLLQSSSEEDSIFLELSDSQLDKEAEIVAFLLQKQTRGQPQADQTSTNSPNAAKHLHAATAANRTKKPIDYFSIYFDEDTWVEIETSTNTLSNIPNPVSAREVACFVGIHIAMGTLKFPSPKLYWQDLTKVPLIAEAMPLVRFLELTRFLKLNSPSSPGDQKEKGQQLKKRCPQSPAVISQNCHVDVANVSQTPSDPLWKVRPLLCRFNAGCRPQKRQGEYAVDQYRLPLTAKMHDNRPSLQCTTLVGLGGLLLHVDLKLDLSDKEDVVEKMVPEGSMVFLCKQELSTPAMLERLLASGVHGAGRVGGARGHIGDEFVSSDGKLMLRRAHCGFILSTAGRGQMRMTSLICSFEKAQISARFNKELQSLYCIPLTAPAPSSWPQAVLWHLVDMALVNSWLLYRQDHAAAPAPLTFMAFRLEVSKAMILSSSSDTQDSVPPQPPSENAHATSETPGPALVDESALPDATTRYDGSGHWPEQLGEGEGGRCRFGECQRTSRVLCLKCCVFLCISRNHNCFLNFHNQGNLLEE